MTVPEAATPDVVALGRWLGTALNAQAVEISGCARLAGGHIADAYRFDADVEGGPHEGRHALVARVDSRVPMPGTLTRAEEYRVQQVAHAAGVATPQPMALCGDPSVLGGPFFVAREVAGTALPARLLNDASVTRHGDEIVAAIGAEMARLHRLRPPLDGLEWLPEPRPSPAEARVEALAVMLESIGSPQPVIEWGLRHLRRYAQPFANVALCHRDLRIGNVMLDGPRLVALLDFEFAAFGDPHEDLGWFCARCWRHGRPQYEAGGLGTRNALYRGYEMLSDIAVEHARVRYYELFAVVRWSIIVLLQGERLARGAAGDAATALDLALTTHKGAELDLEILETIDALRGET